MNITIEHLQLSELVESLRIQADDVFPDLKEEKRLEMLAEKWYTYAEFCTCRDENDQLVGMIVFYANKPENRIVYISHVYVSGEYRGKGVFTQLFHKILEYTKTKGFRHIRLEVKINNQKAQKAYLRNGFTYEGNASDNSIYMGIEI